jgi:hypothetical protein
MPRVALDQTLLALTERAPRRRGGLTERERIAINLFWRYGVRVALLAKVFRVSKNTIYYTCLTGTADSYPNVDDTNRAKKTNELIDSIGFEAAWNQYVTDDMVRKVNRAMADLEAEHKHGRAA